MQDHKAEKKSLNRLFNVFNKRGRVGYIFAPNEDIAKKIAMANGRAKNIKNLTCIDITDKTEPINGWEEALNGSPGFGAIQIQSETIQDLLNRLKGLEPETEKIPPTWVVR